MQFERRPSQRYARRQSHVVRERQQRDRPVEDSSAKIPAATTSVSGTDAGTPSTGGRPISDPTRKKAEIEQDLIILDSSHEEANTSGSSSNGLIVGLNKSPQLHARLLSKTPTGPPNHASRSNEVSERGGGSDFGAAAANGVEDHRLDELIKNLTKESMTMGLEDANEKEKVETACHSKLNTLLINIPNNHSVKSTNQGLAKPLAPDQLKCNILKGTFYL